MVWKCLITERFSGSRGFRGRSFPTRPFMGRGRDSGKLLVINKYFFA